MMWCVIGMSAALDRYAGRAMPSIKNELLNEFDSQSGRNPVSEHGRIRKGRETVHRYALAGKILQSLLRLLGTEREQKSKPRLTPVGSPPLYWSATMSAPTQREGKT
jgi:hypothetical protein